MKSKRRDELKCIWAIKYFCFFFVATDLSVNCVGWGDVQYRRQLLQLLDP